MASTHSLFARLLRAGTPPAADVPDGRLLADALTRRDPAAFEALVSRHGPTVWAVCRRQLRNPADAEDAFQATFLVLLRKGGTLTGVTSVGGWLYRVAFRTALKARTSAARRSRRESVVAKPEAEFASEFNEDAAAVHDELAHLPNIYRLAVLMCDLEGLTRRDAAERLGWKEGTLSGRLNRGRKLLADRLRARGVVPLAVAVGASVLPAKLAAETVESGLCELGFEGMFRAAPPTVAALTRGVLHDMATKYAMKVVAALVLAVGTLAALGVGLTDGPTEPTATAAPVPKPPQLVDPGRVMHEHIFLASHQKIQKELRLSAEVRVAILDALAEIAEEELEAAKTGGVWLTPGAPAPAKPGKDFFALQRAVVAKHLTAAEFKRLTGIEWQLCGAIAFTVPEVATALALTDRQKATVAGAVQTMFKTLQGKGAMRQAVMPYWNEEEFPELWKTARDTALDQLTAAQRKKWDELIGPKLSFDPVKHLRTFGHVMNRVGEPAPEPGFPPLPAAPPGANLQPLPPVVQPPAPPPGGPGVQPVPAVPQAGPLPARAPGELPPPDLPLLPPGGPGTLPPLPLPPASGPPIMR